MTDSNRFRDFDAWEAERKGEPLRYKIRGQEFTLPATLPAIIPIRAMRLKAAFGTEAEVPQSDMLDLALSLFGEEQLDRLLATGIDMDALAEIIQWAIGVYTGETADPNAQSPEAADAPG